MGKLGSLPAKTTPTPADKFIMYDATGVQDATVLVQNLLNIIAANSYNPYKFFTYRNAALSATTGPILFDTVLYDTSSNYNTGTGRFTAPVAGFYIFSAMLTTTFASTGRAIGPGIMKNGSNYILATEVITYNATFNESFAITTPPLQLAANDYIQVGSTDGTSAYAVGASPIVTYFAGYLFSTT